MDMNVKLQESFLNALIKKESLVFVYLLSGIKLQGIIKYFDDTIIILYNETTATQMVFKHAISTIMSA